MSGLSLALLVAAASKWTVLDGVCPDYDRYSAGWADYTGDFQKVEDCEAACNSHNCSTFTFNHHVKPGVCQGYAPRPPSCRALPGFTPPHTHTPRVAFAGNFQKRKPRSLVGLLPGHLALCQHRATSHPGEQPLRQSQITPKTETADVNRGMCSCHQYPPLSMAVMEGRGGA